MFWLLANLLIRSALILAAGMLLCHVFRKMRALQRHRILFSSFVLLLLWPLFAAVIPEVVLPAWTHPSSTGSVTIQQGVVARRAVAQSSGLVVPPGLVWGLAAFLALLPLLIAQLRLRVLVRRAVPCEDLALNSLLRELCSQLGFSEPPALLIHPEPLMPMASGVRNPRIILPADCSVWTPERCRIVLLHELAHIGRRDLLTQRCARLIAALWWFQPLAWGALRLLRRESERACDEIVISFGVRPSDYAAELLAIAQAFAVHRTAAAAGLAMARPAGLEDRLRSILQPPVAPSQPSVVLALCCLTALTVAASAVTLSSETQTLSKRGHTMKQTLFAGLLASAGLSAATIGGSLYDPSGAAVPNAKALLYDPDTNTKFETTTAADGKFAFETLPAGQYILRVQRPGFVTLLDEVDVKADGIVNLTLNVEQQPKAEPQDTPATTTHPTAFPEQPKRVRIGGAVAEVNLTTKVQPIYPKTAKDAHTQGTVEFETVISKEGVPLDIRVVRSPSDDLTQSALEAVRQWRYKPTLLNGNPVEVITDVMVNYTLMK